MLNLWSDVQGALRRYSIQEQDLQATTFAWPEAGPPIAIFQVVLCEFLGREQIFIGVNVMSDSEITAHDALRMNSELLIGALISFDGVVALKHVMRLGCFDAAELHAVIDTLASTAERAVRRLRRRDLARSRSRFTEEA